MTCSPSWLDLESNNILTHYFACDSSFGETLAFRKHGRFPALFNRTAAVRHDNRKPCCSIAKIRMLKTVESLTYANVEALLFLDSMFNSISIVRTQKGFPAVFPPGFQIHASLSEDAFHDTADFNHVPQRGLSEGLAKKFPSQDFQ